MTKPTKTELEHARARDCTRRLNSKPWLFELRITMNIHAGGLTALEHCRRLGIEETTNLNLRTPQYDDLKVAVGEEFAIRHRDKYQDAARVIIQVTDITDLPANGLTWKSGSNEWEATSIDTDAAIQIAETVWGREEEAE